MIGMVTSLDTTSIVALLMIVIIGLPHGAFDGAVANYLGAGKTIFSGIRFFTTYMASAIVVIVIWIFLPSLSLVAFLIISMVHFGWGDANAKTNVQFILQVVVHGGLVVFGTVNFHITEVTQLFKLLTNGDSAAAIQVSQIMFLGILFLSIIYLFLVIKNSELMPRFIELIIIALILMLLPPLLGFAVYFCFVHTGRHMLHIWKKLQIAINSRVIFIQAIGLTAISWLLGLGALYFFDSGDVDADILRVVFIGLAALTVPHMILVDGFFRNKKI